MIEKISIGDMVIINWDSTLGRGPFEVTAVNPVTQSVELDGLGNVHESDIDSVSSSPSNQAKVKLPLPDLSKVYKAVEKSAPANNDALSSGTEKMLVYYASAIVWNPTDPKHVKEMAQRILDLLLTENI